MKQPYDCLWDPAKEPTAPLSWCWRRRVRVLLDFADHAATDSAFAIMAMSPQLTFQVLAADVEQMAEYLNHSRDVMGFKTDERVGYAIAMMRGVDPGASPVGAWPLPNVGIGATITDQASADRAVPILLQCPAAWRWLRCEPSVGPVAIGRAVQIAMDADPVAFCGLPTRGNGINWVELAGGEDPLHPDWARQLRDQCHAAGVPFWFSGWGSWIPREQIAKFDPDHGWMIRAPYSCAGASWGILNRSGRFLAETTTWNSRENDPRDDFEVTVYRIGPDASGRQLDGREHDGLPEIGGASCQPTPGSEEARKIGCNCPTMDNGHGRGAHGTSGKDAVFFIRADCLVHGGRPEIGGGR